MKNFAAPKIPQNSGSSALLTDLYQLTMLQGYFLRGMADTAVFEFFVRSLPANRSFVVAAGLEQVLLFLEEIRFSPDELEWLASTKRFRPEFLEHLGRLHFTGDVDALPEGTIFFPQEPIIRITARLPEAQLIETRLINLIQFQTLIVSKAVRCVLVAPGKTLVDFGLRRAHGAEAGLLAARAAYLAGFAATSNVLAGRQFGIPISGTMAHSFVQVHADEAEAFEWFAEANPGDVVLLLDTYDTEAAVHKVIGLADRLKRKGINVRGVRLDSGDLSSHAFRVREILDQGGLQEIAIFASGNIDEYELDRLVTAGAPISGFGIGSRLDTSADVPYLDCAYKIQEYAGRPLRKRSEGKATWPGRKQVCRHFDRGGRLLRDVVTLDGDVTDGDPLLQPFMRGGRRLAPSDSIQQIRDRVRIALSQLPARLRMLQSDEPYLVEIAPSVRRLARTVDESILPQ